MEKQLNLILTNRWKATVLIVGIVVVTLLMLVGIITVFERSKLLGSLLGVIGVGAFALLPERVAKHFSAEHAIVAFDATGITVSYAASGDVRRLEFADVASYYAGLEFDFTIRPRRGEALVFHLNSKLHPRGMGPLVALQQHFDWAASRYNQTQLMAPPGEMPYHIKHSGVVLPLEKPAAAPIRKLGFVSQPAGAFWFVVLAGLTVWLGQRALQPNASEGAWGGFIFTGLVLGFYASIWWHER